MPEYTVTWEVKVHGSCTVEADDEVSAIALVQTGEGAELENIHEMLGPVEVTGSEYFQG